MNRATAGNTLEIDPHRFITEASDLCIKPGEFPERIETTLGNGQAFIKTHNDLGSWCYRQDAGCATLRVFND